MSETEVQVTNELGLHARAAARFVHLANRFQSKVVVIKGSSRVDGKSILGLLTLAASAGSRLRLEVEGADEEQALQELVELIRGRFGEDS
ncbi:MAG: HPr family phosphocarrier protein [bacterium]|nr:HPr family phosphocarrier protein [bacterium]